MTTQPIEAAFPLTPLQEGMLYHTIRTPAAGLFHLQCEAALHGTLDRAHFSRAWELATTRHAALRTFFTWENRERPLQVVRSDAPLPVEWLDWCALDAQAQEARWKELLQTDRERGFDLTVAPLMRLTVVHLAPTRHRLLWSVHHAVMDGWSAFVVLDEVVRDHATLRDGGTPVHTVAPRFDRYVGWLAAQDRASDMAFWRRTLAGHVESVPLPGARLDAARTGERAHASALLSVEETSGLQAAAARLRVTVNTLLMGAWAVMLARHAGRDDVLFGVTVSDRPAEIAHIERAVGLYLSTVPVRAPMQRDTAVGDWLRALQHMLSESRAHGAPGLAAIQACSAVPSGDSLFDSLVVLELQADSMPAFARRGGTIPTPDDGLRLTSATGNVPNDVPFVLMAFPGEQLMLDVVFDPTVVPSWIAERVPAQLVMLLAEFCALQEGPLEDIDLLGDEERALLQEVHSGARAATPDAIDVLSRFEAQVAARPDAPALQTEFATVTYRALDAHAGRLASRLRHAGIAAGDTVGILAERSVEAIAAMFAALKVGAAYVPLDATMPTARVGRLAAGLDALFVAPAFASRLPPSARAIVLDDAAKEPEQASRSDIDDATRDALAAYVVFTSGSTGEPKGVVVERRQLAASNAARDFYYPDAPRAFLLMSSLAVDSSIAGIFWTLGSGGTLVLPATRAEQDIEALTRLVERAGVTHTLLVPSLYRSLLEHADTRRLASLRCVIVAGEACTADVVRLHHARLRDVALHNEYGPSEATVWATAGELRAPVDGSDEPVTIGRPIPGARVYLLDDLLRPVPLGSTGELCIGGRCVARGYLGLPDETARRFVGDPFEEGGRLYRTGDRARFREDGRIEFLGRSDEQLKIRGFRVEPQEIERALAGHPAVREAAVTLTRPAPDGDAAALVAALAAMPGDDAMRLLLAAEAMP